MAARRTTGKAESRIARGRRREDALSPAAPARAALPADYVATLGAIKRRIQQERVRVVLSANSAMVLLYWDIGRMILERQERAGWGAKVVDRLAADLGAAFPDMKGFSPRNLKYMRAFAAAWPDRKIVQEPLARPTWFHNIALLDGLKRCNRAAQLKTANLAQPVRELDGRNLTQPVAEIPGGDNVILIEDVRDTANAANLRGLSYGG